MSAGCPPDVHRTGRGRSRGQAEDAAENPAAKSPALKIEETVPPDLRVSEVRSLTWAHRSHRGDDVNEPDPIPQANPAQSEPCSPWPRG